MSSSFSPNLLLLCLKTLVRNEHWRSPSEAVIITPEGIPCQEEWSTPATEPGSTTSGSKWSGKLMDLRLQVDNKNGWYSFAETQSPRTPATTTITRCTKSQKSLNIYKQLMYQLTKIPQHLQTADVPAHKNPSTSTNS